MFKSGKVEEELEKVVAMVNVVKKYADSPVADIIVQLTPFNLDDITLKFIRNLLNKTLKKYESLRKAVSLQTVATELAVKQTNLSKEEASIRVEKTYQDSKKYPLFV